MPKVFISVGSNIKPEKNIMQAVRLLRPHANLTALSTFYRTPALDRPADPHFINGIIAIDTSAPPLKLNKTLKTIEKHLGRVRTGDTFAPRPLDLDIVYYGSRVIRNRNIQIPDPHLFDRPFVAIPLAELAPALMIPGAGMAVADIAHKMRTHTMKKLAVFTRNLRKELKKT